MKAIKAYIEKSNTNCKVVMLNELMRSYSNANGCMPIDLIRKDPKAYLDLQCMIIREKINQEENIAKLAVEYKDYDDVYVLIDRSINDSIFYLTFYVDKSGLSIDDMEKFGKLLNEALAHSKKAHSSIYDCVLQYSPFNGSNTDCMRPSHIDTSKHIEYAMIDLLNGVQNQEDEKCCYMYTVDPNDPEMQDELNKAILNKELW